MSKLLQIERGDLLNSTEEVIAHGCNTRGIMGAGIAGQIAKKYPHVLFSNEAAVAAGWFVPGYAQLIRVAGTKAVFNLATQDELGAHARLEWVYLAFRNMAERCAVEKIERVAIPEIGCGIGGLQWPMVEHMIWRAILPVMDRGHKLDVIHYIYEPAVAAR